MNALDVLRSQHREMESIFGAIESSTGVDRKVLFMDLADKLSLHMQLEEQVFYPAVYELDAEELQAAVIQHGNARPIIDELLRMEGDNDRFNDTLEELKGTVLHHIDEEEGGLFVRCEEELAPELLADLGEQLEDLWSQLTAEDDLEPLPAMSAHHHVRPYGSTALQTQL